MSLNHQKVTKITHILNTFWPPYFDLFWRCRESCSTGVTGNHVYPESACYALSDIWPRASTWYLVITISKGVIEVVTTCHKTTQNITQNKHKITQNEQVVIKCKHVNLTYIQVLNIWHAGCQVDTIIGALRWSFWPYSDIM